ncbi:MAG: hypothetical protein MZV64_15235 [Ignavibacteriales bacterium]|nr:hypothetical protein [Ignavibacteriales bacterium]
MAAGRGWRGRGGLLHSGESYTTPEAASTAACASGIECGPQMRTPHLPPLRDRLMVAATGRTLRNAELARRPARPARGRGRAVRRPRAAAAWASRLRPLRAPRVGVDVVLAAERPGRRLDHDAQRAPARRRRRRSRPAATGQQPPGAARHHRGRFGGRLLPGRRAAAR